MGESLPLISLIKHFCTVQNFRAWLCIAITRAGYLLEVLGLGPTL